MAWRAHLRRFHSLSALVSIAVSTGRSLPPTPRITFVPVGGCGSSDRFRFVAGRFSLVRFPPSLWKRRRVRRARALLLLARHSSFQHPVVRRARNARCLGSIRSRFHCYSCRPHFVRTEGGHPLELATNPAAGPFIHSCNRMSIFTCAAGAGCPLFPALPGVGTKGCCHCDLARRLRNRGGIARGLFVFSSASLPRRDPLLRAMARVFVSASLQSVHCAVIRTQPGAGVGIAGGIAVLLPVVSHALFWQQCTLGSRSLAAQFRPRNPPFARLRLQSNRPAVLTRLYRRHCGRPARNQTSRPGPRVHLGVAPGQCCLESARARNGRKPLFSINLQTAERLAQRTRAKSVLIDRRFRCSRRWSCASLRSIMLA